MAELTIRWDEDRFWLAFMVGGARYAQADWMARQLALYLNGREQVPSWGPPRA